jgi:hypothetical protein
VRDLQGPDRWYSGKHRRHGGNIQVLADPQGRLMWTSPVTPGATHDLRAARTHVLPALYALAVRALPVLADKGYLGAGAGVRTPYPRPAGVGTVHAATLGWNSYVNTARVPVERAIATLKVRWPALRRITLCPWGIGDIVSAALVLTRQEKAY